MKIKWYGHSAFGVTSSGGVSIITDPYVPGCYDGAVGYGKIEGDFDIVLQSHDHPDHAGAGGLKGKPEIIKKPGEYEVEGVKIKGVGAYHDHHKGANRGKNVIYVFETDGARVCFCGDLGHTLDDDYAKSLGRVDVLLVPIGGHFTIDAAEAWQVVDKLKPKIVIPMHYKTEVLGFPIAGVEPFIGGKNNVEFAGSSEINVDPGNMPEQQTVMVMDYSK